MKKPLQFLLALSLCSCGIFNSYTRSVEENRFARKELREKKFKTKFREEMSRKINSEYCYVSYYESSHPSSNFYSYLLLFKNGQYANFTSRDEEIDVRDLDRANYIGYYIIENDVLKLETPTGNINTKSYRVIWEFEIGDSILKNKKSKFEYKLARNISIGNIEPNW